MRVQRALGIFTRAFAFAKSLTGDRRT